LQQKLTYLGTLLSSFPQASRATEAVLDEVFGLKRIERLTERIGQERVCERDQEVAAWEQRTLLEKEVTPAGVKPPGVAAVMPDGGRLQLCERNEDSSTHWHEYKAACLLELHSSPHVEDPCPQIPEMFLEPGRMETLTRQIGRKAAEGDDSAEDVGRGIPVPPTSAADPPHTSSPPEYAPPDVISREVTATRQDSRAFGKMLAARAWSLGMFASPRKAYVGDGQNWLWSVWKRHFKPFGFVAVLDFIHALTYVFAAATAGRRRHQGWLVYRRWITWVWQGEVSRVIAELAARQQEIGLPTDQDGPTSVRQIVTDALTYLQNQQSRMNYPAYRQQGLPITSSHVESTIKQLNHRVKGSEKFWSDRGAESLLQLRADTLSDSAPLDRFWRQRPSRMTGARPSAQHAT
jgi:hypothetical protein